MHIFSSMADKCKELAPSILDAQNSKTGIVLAIQYIYSEDHRPRMRVSVVDKIRFCLNSDQVRSYSMTHLNRRATRQM